MISENNLIKMIFGFKVKYHRLQKELSYQQLSAQTGLSTSYLHDIEKGRKYPKVDKISALANAFEVSYDYMVSLHSSKKLQPVIDFLTSEFIKEFPLDQFGIGPDKLFELFSNAPDRVNAFLNALIRIARNYQMKRESFYLAALRSYQDMYDNHFEELEAAVKTFRQENLLEAIRNYSTLSLETILLTQFGIQIDRQILPTKTELYNRRSYYSEAKKTLFLNAGLSGAQERFLIGRELGFQFLKLKERPYVTRIADISSFEKLLNNFKASYFSVALLLDEHLLVEDVTQIMTTSSWQPQLFLDLLEKYNVTPEMLLQRLTNILPHHFGLKDLFFIRLAGENELKYYRMTKELHLAQPQSPYANELNEHYCRRWVSVNIIKRLNTERQINNARGPIIDVQISNYAANNNQYLCISIAKADARNETVPVSVTLGLLITNELRNQIRFLNDPKLHIREVHTTCERCKISDCEARVAAPTFIERQLKLDRQFALLKEIDLQ